MVKQEYYGKSKSGYVIHRAYSDKGLKIIDNERKIPLDEAFDKRLTLRHYEETNQKISILQEDDDE